MNNKKAARICWDALINQKNYVQPNYYKFRFPLIYWEKSNVNGGMHVMCK